MAPRELGLLVRRYASYVNRETHGKEILSVVVTAEDLAPFNWDWRINIAFKTWMQRKPTTEARRQALAHAKAARSITGRRNFFRSGDFQSLWVGCYPYPTLKDALGALPQSPEDFYPGKKPRGTVLESREVAIAVDGSRRTWAYEERRNFPDGPKTERVLACAAGRWDVVVVTRGIDDGVSWAELQSIAEIQIGKLRSLQVIDS